MRSGRPRTGDERLSFLEQRSLVPQCVEIGLDIDNFTYNTFADCYGAIDWALGVLAGVDLVYRTELNDFITLQASYVNVWEVAEPWAGTVNDAGTMLDQLRLEWNANNPVLAGANWDMVHLMSKRGDTGTGGIAYLGVVVTPTSPVGSAAPWTTSRIFQSSSQLHVELVRRRTRAWPQLWREPHPLVRMARRA